MCLIQTLAEKVAHASLHRLIEAKRESDRRNYRAKHAIIKHLIASEPDNFHIDSEQGGIVGLTHSTGFKIHVPRDVISTDRPLRRLPRPALLEAAASAGGGDAVGTVGPGVVPGLVGGAGRSTPYGQAGNAIGVEAESLDLGPTPSKTPRPPAALHRGGTRRPGKGGVGRRRDPVGGKDKSRRV